MLVPLQGPQEIVGWRPAARRGHAKRQPKTPGRCSRIPIHSCHPNGRARGAWSLPRPTWRTRGEGSRPRAEPPPIHPNTNGRHVLERMHLRAATRQGHRPKHWSRLWCDAVSPSTWKSPHGVASGPSTLGSHQEASLPPNFQHSDSRRSRSPLPAPHSRIPRDLKPLPAGGRDSEGTNNLSSQPRRCLQAKDSTITAEAPPPPLHMPAPPNLLPCCLSA